MHAPGDTNTSTWKGTGNKRVHTLRHWCNSDTESRVLDFFLHISQFFRKNMCKAFRAWLYSGLNNGYSYWSGEWNSWALGSMASNWSVKCPTPHIYASEKDSQKDNKGTWSHAPILHTFHIHFLIFLCYLMMGHCAFWFNLPTCFRSLTVWLCSGISQLYSRRGGGSAFQLCTSVCVCACVEGVRGPSELIGSKSDKGGPLQRKKPWWDVHTEEGGGGV